MTPSARKPWLLALARRYARSRLRRAFDGVWVSGLAAARAASERGPLVVAANHVAWWDPFVVVLLDQLLGTESHALMDAANLRRLPFFGWIGAVPIERGAPRVALRQLRAAVDLVVRPRQLLWIFPQGRQRPAHVRPLGLEPGVERLVRYSGAALLPLALDYGFGSTARPEIRASFEEPIVDGRGGALLEALEARLVTGLERIDGSWETQDSSFECVVGSRRETLPLGARLLSAPRRWA